MIVWALGMPALSIRSMAYQPARPLPSWTSQDQMCSGLAAMVIARVALNPGRTMSWSPGRGRATSSSVAPHRIVQGRTTVR
jgi:hypothetical protein